MKPYKGFLPKFYIDVEEGIIRGKTLNTRDTITFYGKTVDEALRAFRDSVDEYLEFCKEIGVEPEKPYSGKLLVRLNPEMHRELSLLAQQVGKSINSFVAGQLAMVVEQSSSAGYSRVAASGEEAATFRGNTKTRTSSKQRASESRIKTPVN